MQKKGRKIIHRRRLYKRKSTKRKVISTIITILIIAGLIFVGYSVAEPILDFFNKDDKNDNTTGEWTPPVIENTTDDTQTTEPTQDEPVIKDTNALLLSINALQSKETLETEITNAKKNGYNSVIVTLKAAGGEIEYKTENNIAITYEAVKGTLTAKEIYDTINNAGLIPIAKLNILKDHLVSRYDIDMSYKFENGGYMWLDAKASNGGKAWLSPFEEKSRQYIADITKEIYNAGFKYIISDDIIFPSFRASDLNYIGNNVKDANRYQKLVSLEHVIISNSNDAIHYLEINALDVITSNCEVLKPSELTGVIIVPEITPSTLNNKLIKANGDTIDLSEMSIDEKVKAVLKEVKSSCETLIVTPYIVTDNLTDEQIDSIITSLKNEGYKNYFIK